MNPVAALIKLMAKGAMNPNRHLMPGDVVKSISQEVRESLRFLTSEQLSRIRINPEELMDHAYETRSQIRKLMSDFDQRIKS